VADNKSQDGISAVTFFSVVVQIFVSMSIVLSAAGKPEDSWFRHLTLWYLVVMVGLYTVVMVIMARRQRAAKRQAAGSDPGAQS
jgi:hypothetical protein